MEKQLVIPKEFWGLNIKSFGAFLFKKINELLIKTDHPEDGLFPRKLHFLCLNAFITNLFRQPFQTLY